MTVSTHTAQVIVWAYTRVCQYESLAYLLLVRCWRARIVLHRPRSPATVHHTHMLDLRTWNITCIPPEIVILDDLTVLRIGGTGMTNLPPELGTLHALEALEITSATNLAAVPDIFDAFRPGRSVPDYTHDYTNHR